ncbi:MAG: GDSL-type esterase/lipase family protein, partial [Patescibacteria group bacterium]
MRVLVFGASTTQGFWDTEGGWVQRLRKHYDSLALEDLHDNKQPEIFNLGVSGDTTRNLLGRIEFETKVRKWPEDPQVAVVAISTNDDLFENGNQRVEPAEFRTNIEKVIKILELLVEKVIFVGNSACDEKLTTPVFWAEINYTNKQLQKYEQIVQAVAAAKKIPFVPIFLKFQQKLLEGKKLLADGLHPND